MDDTAPLGFIAMCGIPFVGKSTLACELAHRCELALVSVDAIVTNLGIDLGADAGNQRGWARAMAEGFGMSRELLAKRASVIYDTANHTRRNRDRCRRVAEQAGAAFQLIWLDVPVEVARQRQLANRSNPRRIDVPDAAFWQIVEAFESPIDEPDVIRWQPGIDVEMLVRELNLAQSKGRLPERSEEFPDVAAARSTESRNERVEKDAPASLTRASREDIADAASTRSE